jgi:hypothetical protein
MIVTLDEVVSKINKRLNYPSFSFEDMDLFFDQAISELNTLLHIGVKPITKLVLDFTAAQLNIPNVVLLSSEPTSSTIIPTSDNGGANLYYYDVSDKKYYVRTEGQTEYTAYTELYGLVINYDYAAVVRNKYYQAWPVSDVPVWFPDRNHNPLQFDLSKYLPVDWITLFLVPYVCAALATRDGGNANAFTDEFIQGFNQLKNNYDVPSFARLNEVAGDPAYTEDVSENINDVRFFQIIVPTRAIKSFMRIPDGLEATYFYTKGW